MATFMEPLDPELVKERLSQQPFVSISGVTNVRTLGPYPTKTPGIVTRSDFLYRSGEISGITDEGFSLYLLRKLDDLTLNFRQIETTGARN